MPCDSRFLPECLAAVEQAPIRHVLTSSDKVFSDSAPTYFDFPFASSLLHQQLHVVSLLAPFPLGQRLGCASPVLLTAVSPISVVIVNGPELNTVSPLLGLM